jgi:hypothetical protein
MTSTLLFKKRIPIGDEGLDSLVVISFRSWVLWVACVLVLVVLIVWSFTAVIQTHVPANNNNPQVTIKQQAPIMLVFPIVKRWLHQSA